MSSQDKKCKSSPLCSHNTNGRDLDKPCSISFTPESDWEKRFEDKFPCMGVSNEAENCVYRHDQFQAEKSEMIEFIRSLIQQAEQRNVKENVTSYRQGVQATLERVREIIEIKFQTTLFELPNPDDTGWKVQTETLKQIKKALLLALDNEEV